MTGHLPLKPSLVIASLAALAAITGGACRAEPPAKPSQIENSPPARGATAALASEDASDEARLALDGGPTAPVTPAVDADPTVTGTPAADVGEASSAGDATEGAGAERAAAPPDVSGEAVVAHDRGALERAYIAIYCAQRRGETARLKAIYAEHGFSDPREWRRTWIPATRDHEWLATITRMAIEACP
ncbi:MAG: hypothetical protein CVU56_20665 [Deltaproteobacteria bacterium HGW-Deltaproteobacteria-14]|nr:MAG: hypothetical protein CVU56_20665 [Deltaproteobacteria bacterium HGW-Deltaproteobacteria-14]